MKNLIHICLLLIVTITLSAQDKGSIHYNVIQKLEISVEGLPPGIDLSGMLPKEKVEDKILIFDSEESLYYDSGKSEEEEMELSSDDGSIKMVVMTSDIENRLYTNLKTKEVLDQQAFMDKAFIISSKLEKLKWKITSEKIKYLGYECIKATTTISKDDVNKEVVAWFAPAIKSTFGPGKFGQLPGAVLMVSVDGGKTEIKATEVTLGMEAKIEKPTDGKHVTKEEFEKIMEEKIEEMSKMYGGSRNSVISIRG